MFSHLRIRHVAVSTLVNNKKPIPQHNGLDVVHARQLIGYYVWGEKIRGDGRSDRGSEQCKLGDRKGVQRPEWVGLGRVGENQNEVSERIKLTLL